MPAIFPSVMNRQTTAIMLAVTTIPEVLHDPGTTSEEGAL
jgi:hypothetical protein